MTETRPVEDLTGMVARLQKELDDMRSTVGLRTIRRPTGDIEPTIRQTAKSDTLLLDGATISRTTYAVLWQWVVDNDLVTAGVFGAGDGSTTFVLPDLRGKAAVGATVVDPVGTSFGSATTTLTASMIPEVDGVTTLSSNPHIHGGQTDNDGGHGGHFPGTSFNAAGGPDLGLAAWNSNGGSRNHSHHFTSATEDVGHDHGFSFGSASPDPFFVVQPSYAVNWLIWT